MHVAITVTHIIIYIAQHAQIDMHMQMKFILPPTYTAINKFSL